MGSPEEMYKTRLPEVLKKCVCKHCIIWGATGIKAEAKIIWRIHFSHKKSQSSSVNQVKVSPAAQHGPGSWELVSGLRTGDSQQWADFRSRAKWEHFGGLRTVYHFTVGIISNCIRWYTNLYWAKHAKWHGASCVTHFRAMMSNWSCSHVHTFPPTHSLYCWEMMGLYICVLGINIPSKVE